MNNLAHTFKLKGQYNEAIYYCKRSLKIDSKNFLYGLT
ncbi:MAG: tetratricopeptide repeat protein [Saprospiraceae bacterium]|nr:tetratricopeptide repeat protein [Candidatus Vicinibacter affinis]